jgi:hypothetical protein
MTSGTAKKESWYSDTERLISRYCKAQDRLERLRATEQALKENIDELNQNLAEMRGITGITAKYGLIPGGSRSGDSGYMSLMEQYEKQVDNITKQLLQKWRRLASIRARIHAIKEWSAPFGVAVSRFSAEEYSIIEHRYIFRRSNYQIAHIMYCSEYRIRYKLNKIVEYMASWLKIKNQRKINAS